MTRIFIGTMTVLLLGLAAQAQANLITNGGFEAGVYSSTIDGDTNASVPVGWTPNAGYDTLGDFNSVTTLNPHSGTHALLIANDPGYPIAGLGQSFATLSGATYEAQFYIGNSLAEAGYLTASIDGSSEVRVVGNEIGAPGMFSFTSTFADGRVITTNLTSRAGYTSETFDFKGTGRDTLAFAAVNDDDSYFIDDVSVNLVSKGGTGGGNPPTAVPEPAGWLPMMVGCLATGLVLARPRRWAITRDLAT